MDKEVKVVIGANYGDEGKGLVSHCLSGSAASNGRKVLNVFYNGGQQRGHTADGKIHHCTGAGDTLGADTFYHRMLLVDPIALWLERAEVFIDPDCRVVLPCDVVNNRATELERGTAERHGSCGMGIFEACKRSKEAEYYLPAKLIWGDKKDLYDELIRVEKKYGYPRDILYNNDNFMRACEWAKINCVPKYFDEIKDNYDTIIYEGGQGLLLDQTNRDDFPHLTPSSPGVRNIRSDIFDLGVQPELYYVSRSYLTRHGNGPMENETTAEELFGNSYLVKAFNQDETNKTNAWQGCFRFGYLDNEKMLQRIHKDASELLSPGKINLVYTWLDYSKDDGIIRPDGKDGKIDKPSWVNAVFGSTDGKYIREYDAFRRRK